MLYTYEILQRGETIRRLFSTQAINIRQANQAAKDYAEELEEKLKLPKDSVRFTLVKRHRSNSSQS